MSLRGFLASDEGDGGIVSREAFVTRVSLGIDTVSTWSHLSYITGSGRVGQKRERHGLVLVFVFLRFRGFRDSGAVSSVDAPAEDSAAPLLLW